MKNQRIEKCLRAIAAKHDGMLEAETVVAEAKNPRSPLHDRFEWDNTEAAHQYRIWQARQLIKVCVEVIGNGIDPSPVFVSLSTDRGSGGGYRITADVMTDEELREQLLKDALHDMNRFQVQYRNLKQLSGVFAAMKKVKRAA